MSSRAAVARMVRWMPAPVAEVISRLRAAGGRVVVVGGAVRNVFLGLAVPDWDLATDLLPSAVASLFPRVVRAGEKHGTIMVLTASGPVEVTTFRGEGPYLDGRRPAHVRFHGDLEADLSRRDFTINAMAVDPSDRQLVDPHDGRLDLLRRRIRCVGDPTRRFAEDGLRPLRAVRFAGVLDFALERATAAAIPAAMSTFERVAWERKRDELERLLAGARHLAPALSVMRRSGMLERLAPPLARAPLARASALDALAGRPWLRFAGWAALCGLEAEEAAAVLATWKVSSHDQAAVRGWLSAFRALPPGAAPHGAKLRRWMAAVGAESSRGAALLDAALRGTGHHDLPRRVARQLRDGVCLSVSCLAVNGNDMLKLGFAGPEVGRVLRYLLETVLERPSRNRREVLLAIAHRLSTARNRG